LHAARVSLAERPALADYLRGDTLLRRFFEVFLFEELPASDRRAEEVLTRTHNPKVAGSNPVPATSEKGLVIPAFFYVLR
jgi:hypothetical protein